MAEKKGGRARQDPQFKPDIPKEFEELTAENFAYLQMLIEFRVDRLFAHAVPLRQVLYAAVEDISVLDGDGDELIERLSKVVGMDPKTTKYSLTFAAEYVLSRCLPSQIVKEYYYGTERKFPDESNLKDCLLFLAGAFECEYEKLRYNPDFYIANLDLE